MDDKDFLGVIKINEQAIHSHETCWYRDKIGHEFRVIHWAGDLTYYSNWPEDILMVETDKHHIAGVLDCHCDIVKVNC